MLKKFFRYLFVPGVIIFYLLLLVVDDYAVKNSTKLHLDKKIEGFRNGIPKINLILGGSNAFYSLSAEQLNKVGNISWYNLSLSGEGYRNINYYQFLENNFSLKERENIQTILYSSIYYYRKGSIHLRESSNKSIYGLKKNSIKPAFSGFTYIQRFITRGSILATYPPQNNFGDIIFDSNLCVSGDIKQAYDVEDYGIIIEDIIEKYNTFKNIFPNAQILIVFPSDLIDKQNINLFEKNIYDMKQSLSNNFTLKKIGLANKIIFQEPYSVDDLCDTPSHSNNQGRIKRTNEVISILNI